MNKFSMELLAMNYLKNKPTAALTITEKIFLQRITNLSITPAHRVDNLSKVVNPENTFSILIEQTFKRFFQSYALAFNKQHHRKGNLFYKPFKRYSLYHGSYLYTCQCS